MINKIVIFFIKIYKYGISPYMPKACRFYPTCSEYAIEAFKTKRFFEAVSLTLKRLIKCHPLSKQSGPDFLGGIK